MAWWDHEDLKDPKYKSDKYKNYFGDETMPDDQDNKVVSFQSKLTAEQAYKEGTDHQFNQKELRLGPWTSYSLINDPKHLLFTLARYKFAAKISEGKKSIIEVGCGDGAGLPILSQAVDHVFAVDWDSRLTEGNQKRLEDFKNVTHVCRDLNKQDIELANIDVAVTIDVIEHLDPQNQDGFFERILKCLHTNSILITGTPNIYANAYASSQSKAQHINLQSMESLREITKKYCINTFAFSQNDEVVHTGYEKMAHYIWAIGVGIRGKYLL